MRTTLEVGLSLLLVAVVIWFMWRLPVRDERYGAWAPPLALMSAWAGLLGLILSALLWFLPYPDQWVAVGFLLLDPLALGSGILVWWIYRGYDNSNDLVAAHRLQALVGVILGLAATAVGYVYVMTTKAPFTPIGT